MKFILIFIFFIKFEILKSQSISDTVSINIHVSSIVNFTQDFSAEVDKKGDRIKINYSIRDSISRAFYRDSNAKELLNSYVSFDRSNLTPYLQRQRA